MTARPNILLITADDMNWDAVGAYGCPVAGTTPHLDGLASEGVRFEHGHVTIAVCQPSRSAMMTGRYPHRSGGEGFFRLRLPGVPILPDLLRGAGYAVGILGKLPHSTPYADFVWDLERDMPDLGAGRNPAIYQREARAFIDGAIGSGKPFFLMANSHDPHRPFYGNDKPEWYESTTPPAMAPSKVFAPEEVTVPGFLHDLPEVRLEIAEYYNSVRRCDDTVGGILSTLDEAGATENTLVIFLSDNGMAFPFAKTNCYLNSTRTPFVVRWPAQVRKGTVDREHFVSGIDIMPTILEAAGVRIPDGVDGASFIHVLKGEPDDSRSVCFTQFHQTAGRRNYPMRCVQTRRFGYIFNPWSDGKREFINESQSGRTWAAMQNAAEEDPTIAARVELFEKRVPEEFYDFESDPDGLHNLIDDPVYADEVQGIRSELESWMEQTDDPALAAFRDRGSRAALDRLMEETEVLIGGPETDTKGN